MMRWSIPFVFMAFSIGIQRPSSAAEIPSTDEATQAITRLREGLIDSFNKRDIDRLLGHLDEDVIATWQNGEVCRGPAAIKAYYNKMMQGDGHIVDKVSCNPQIEGRHVYGDWAASWGHMNDEFVLKDGTAFKFNSNFTATIAKRGEQWKVTSFHASVNAFDNPILGVAVKNVGGWSAAGGAFAGLIIGVLLMILIQRRRRKSHVA